MISRTLDFQLTGASSPSLKRGRMGPHPDVQTAARQVLGATDPHLYLDFPPRSVKYRTSEPPGKLDFGLRNEMPGAENWMPLVKWGR
jgi:hypothetical protein